MTDAEHKGEISRVVDVTKAGPLTLRNHGISFAVDETGQVLRYPDGTPIDGQRIEDTVNQPGRRLTNAQAAGNLIAAKEFINGVQARLDELRAADSAVSEVIDPSAI